MNPLFLSDSYKLSHWKQYPPGTNLVYSYLESRGGKFPELAVVGLNYALKRYLAGVRVTRDAVAEAREFAALHFGNDQIFNHEGWKHIVDDHKGRWPVSIKAVPEGTVVPVHNVLMTVENTCPKCYWVTNFLETLLVQQWYPITVATLSRECKRIIAGYLKKTGDPSLVDFKLHDFGFRGVSSVESAMIGGMAHLTNFLGTDTLIALWGARKYYGEQCAGFSIPASEHSTITSWGQDAETEAFANMLAAYPTGYVACVSDSFNIYKAITEKWGRDLKDVIERRDGTLVVRPDSGEPRKVVIECLTLLGEAFGYTVNNKGYKVLNPKVRLIQGDGVGLDSIADILLTMDKLDWSADNIAFGMGGALLQKLDRDTNKFAFKCSYVEGEDVYEIEEVAPDGIAGTFPWSRDVYKDPITDPGKASKRGRLKLVRKTGGGLYTQPAHLSKDESNVLVEIFRDGNILKEPTIGEIRERVKL